MNRSCRNSQEKKSNEKSKERSKKTPLFFCTKKSATTNDSGYGCRHAFIFYHSVKNDMGGDKNPLPRMIADMGAKHAFIFITA